MQLVTDDRQGGLEAPGPAGRPRTFRPDERGVISLPEELAGYGRRAARVCPLFHVYRKGYAGFDAAELRERYERWREARGTVDAAGQSVGAGGVAV